jgi:hypothetical protein
MTVHVSGLLQARNASREDLDLLSDVLMEALIDTGLNPAVSVDFAEATIDIELSWTAPEPAEPMHLHHL